MCSNEGADWGCCGSFWTSEAEMRQTDPFFTQRAAARWEWSSYVLGCIWNLYATDSLVLVFLYFLLFFFFTPCWGASLLSFLSAVLRRKKPRASVVWCIYDFFLHVPVVKPTVHLFFSHLSKPYYSSMAIVAHLCRADCFCECIPTGVLFLFSCHLFCNLVQTQYFTSVCQSSLNKFSSSGGWVVVLKAWLLGSLCL